MQRVWMAVALAAVACSEKPQEAGACADESQIALVGCATSTLAQIPHDGVWTTRLTFNHDAQSGYTSELSFLPGLERVFDTALEAPPTESLYFAMTETVSGHVYRYGFLGCSAASPTRFIGRFQTCVDGKLATGGSFEAHRVVRREGEAESQGVTLIAEHAVEGDAMDVFVANGHAYVVSHPGGLTVIDLQNPSAPQTVAYRSSGSHRWNAVWVKDDVVFVGSDEEGVVAFDVATPSNPQRLWMWPFPSVNVHTLLLDGNTLYAMSPAPIGETLLIDVTNPRAPSEQGRFQASSAASETDAFPHDASVFEGRLYVNHWSSGVVIANVSTPATPVQLTTVPGTSTTSHASQVGRIGDKVYLFEGGEDWGAGLSIFDVTEPTAATKVGSFSMRESLSIHNLALVGTTLYIAWYQEGLRILDVSNPASPQMTSYFNTWRETDPRRGTSFYDGAIGIRVPGDGYVYLAESSRGLMIFQVP